MSPRPSTPSLSSPVSIRRFDVRSIRFILAIPTSRRGNRLRECRRCRSLAPRRCLPANLHPTRLRRHLGGRGSKFFSVDRRVSLRSFLILEFLFWCDKLFYRYSLLFLLIECLNSCSVSHFYFLHAFGEISIGGKSYLCQVQRRQNVYIIFPHLSTGHAFTCMHVTIIE